MAFRIFCKKYLLELVGAGVFERHLITFGDTSIHHSPNGYRWIDLFQRFYFVHKYTAADLMSVQFPGIIQP